MRIPATIDKEDSGFGIQDQIPDSGDRDSIQHSEYRDGRFMAVFSGFFRVFLGQVAMFGWRRRATAAGRLWYGFPGPNESRLA